MKKRILCITMAVMLLFGFCIQNPTQISAAKKKIEYMVDVQRKVECGKQFYVGDLVKVCMSNSGITYPYYMASELDASYVSDHPEIITVKEDGYAMTKEPGEATVTVSCQGKSAEVSFMVVEKGAISEGREEELAKWEAAAEHLREKIPDKLTLKNGYAFLKTLKEYLRAFENVAESDAAVSDVLDGDFAYKTICGLDPWTDDVDFTVLSVPAASCYNRVVTMMGRYIEQYHPMHQEKYRTGGKYTYYKVLAKESGITLTFKKKLTKQAVLAAYMEQAMYDTTYYEAEVPLRINAKIKKDRMEAHVFLSCEDSFDEAGAGSDFVGVAVIKAGSKHVTVKPTQIYRHVNGKGKYVNRKNLKLKKGVTYRVFLEALQGEGSEYFTIKK